MQSSDVQNSGVEPQLDINELVELFKKQTISYNECRSSYEAGKNTMAKLTAMFSQVAISPPTLDSKKRKYNKRQPVDSSSQTECYADRVEKRKRTPSTSSEATLSDSDGAESDSVKAPKAKAPKAPKAPKEKAVKAPKEKAVKAPKAPKEKAVKAPKETVIEHTESIENTTQSAEPVPQVEEADFTKTVISKAPNEKAVKAVKTPKEKAPKAVKAPKEKAPKAVKEKAPKAVKEKAAKAHNETSMQPIEPHQENTPASEDLGLENSEDGDSDGDSDGEDGDDNEDATEELVVTEKIWMNLKYLVDERTGDMYDIVSEKIIPDKHWDGFNVVMKK